MESGGVRTSVSREGGMARASGHRGRHGGYASPENPKVYHPRGHRPCPGRRTAGLRLSGIARRHAPASVPRAACTRFALRHCVLARAVVRLASSHGAISSEIICGGESTMSSGIESVLHENRVFPPSEDFVKQANISGMAAYQAMCAEAERDFEGFWAKHARAELLWHKPFTKTLDESNAPFFKWFHDGELNASYNCLDRHLATQPDKVAIIFEADDGTVTTITYKELYHDVCRFANALKSQGHQEGRPRPRLHADVDPGGRRDAGVRAHRRHALGGVRRLFGEEHPGAHHRRGRGRGHHRRRAVPRRPRDPAEAGRRRSAGAWAAAKASRRCSSTSAPARRSRCRPGATCGGTTPSRTSPTPASRRGSTPSIRCSSSTRRARPASRRASSIRPAATCCRRS